MSAEASRAWYPWLPAPSARAARGEVNASAAVAAIKNAFIRKLR
jgi:hypothetical protein